MRRALQLANLGKFETSPNPRVGAVIVHNNKIIGEGFHRKYGEAHAEVNAVDSVENKSLLPESTIYVTLEPCSHTGKTPPCADLLVEHKFKKVVICNKDPFDQVNGSGIKKLQTAGIETEVGVLKADGRFLNRRFFTFHEQKRPYIILKWAQSADGFIAPSNQQQKWITGSTAKQLVHTWRAEEAAILVGKNTALIDNPRLTVRESSGKNPTRILVDENLSVSRKCLLFSNEANTLILNGVKESVNDNLELIKSDFRVNLASKVAEVCFERNLESLIIEGGASILQQFIDANIWDEARIFTGDTSFKNGIKAPILGGKTIRVETIENDQLEVIRNL